MTSQARLVGGRYEEGEPLGRGGMADVRRGIDNRLGRAVAIKRLRVDLASDSTFQARFRREAQSAASLNHPTIVSVYDTGEEPDPNGSGITIPYIVMELVTGKTLRDLIREGRKIMPERALEITSGVLEALDYSHRAGIVHRDIKPGNVMLTPQGQVKVMDFGIARAVADTSSTMTQTAAVIGTAQYLSPEQARGETVDARSDLYSTGCLLYELLVGRPPFVGESPVSVAYQHVREEPLPPSSFDPDIPPEVDAVVLKALTKNREHRYQSASEMRADIHRVLAGQQVTAPMAAVAETRAIQPTQVAPSMAATQAYQPQSNDLLPPDNGDDEAEAARARRNRGLAYFLLGLAIVAVAVGAYAIITNGNKDKASRRGRPPPGRRTECRRQAGGRGDRDPRGEEAAGDHDLGREHRGRQGLGDRPEAGRERDGRRELDRHPADLRRAEHLPGAGRDRQVRAGRPGRAGEFGRQVPGRVQGEHRGQRQAQGHRDQDQPGPGRSVRARHQVHADGLQRHREGRGSGRHHAEPGRRHDTLKGLGLAVGYLQDNSDPNAVEGTVVKQNIKGGTKVAKGTKWC